MMTLSKLVSQDAVQLDNLTSFSSLFRVLLHWRRPPSATAHTHEKKVSFDPWGVTKGRFRGGACVVGVA